jgi:hypothetical protein
MFRVFLNRDAEEIGSWTWTVESDGDGFLDVLPVPYDEESDDHDIHSTTLYRLMEEAGYDLAGHRVEYIDGDYGPMATLNPEGN